MFKDKNNTPNIIIRKNFTASANFSPVNPIAKILIISDAKIIPKIETIIENTDKIFSILFVIY